MADKKPKPTSKARMSRKQPRDSYPGRRVENPKEAYSAVQLEEVGAITLLWNQVEGFLDFLLYVTWLHHSTHYFWEITDRIAAIDKKIDLLRIYAANSKILNDAARNAIKTTLDGVSEYRKYRDNIVHSVPFDIEKGIAHRRNRRVELTQTLMTYEALSALFLRLRLLLDELREVDLLYLLADEPGAMAVYAGRVADPLAQRRVRDVPIQTARVLECQKARLSLPPLPEFPEESPAPPWMAALETRRRSEEKP
jgi:hypothetical protein